MLVRGQINCLQTADFSVKAGGYAGARAEKLPADSRFLSPSLAYTVMWAEKIQNIRHIIDNISVQAGQYAVARAEKLPADSRFLCLSWEVCWCLGREIAYRQQISLPKPGGMLVRGQRNFLQTADFSVQAGRILSCGQKVRHTCAVKSVRKRIYLTRKNTCGSLVT